MGVDDARVRDAEALGAQGFQPEIIDPGGDCPLDALIEQEEDLSFRKTGQAMGALLMVKIPELELPDIVNEDYSMEKINQAIMKTVLGA